MLSKNALFILGIIADKPINPYSICKLINYKRKYIKSKVPLQTIYSTIRIFLKDKLVTNKITQVGRTPARINYSITPKGRELLRESALDYLSEPGDTLSELELSIFIIGHLVSNNHISSETALEKIKVCQKELKQNLVMTRKLYAKDTELGVSEYNLLCIKHSMDRLKISLSMVNKIIKKIESGTSWGVSPIPFWRDQVNLDNNISCLIKKRR